MRVLVVLALLCGVAGDARDARAEVTKPPKLLQAVAPDYPPAALAANKQAKVRVRLHIDATGVVTAVDVLEKVGDGFDEAAQAAALQYVFEPAEIDGVAAPIDVETSIAFVIEQQPEPEPVPLTAPQQPHTGPPNHAGSMDAKVSLQGVAVERGTRNKLAGVIVSIAELGLDAVTGDDGSFYFHGIPPGHYEVLAIDPRYDRLERGIGVASRELVEVRLWMRPKGGNPYETVVEGEREVLEVTKRTISRAQMTSVPGTFGDPIRVITTLPGLQRAPFGLGLLLVRGSNPDDTGIFVDGHEVPALFHFLGGPSIFNADMLDSVSLYPGGFSGRFGRHHGGVVALETRDTKDDGIHGDAKVDFIDAGGYIRFPITKDLTAAAAFRRSYIDLFLGFVLPDPGAGTQRIVTPVYSDYSAKLDYNLHADGHLSLFLVGSHDSLHVNQKDLDTMTAQDLSSSIDFWRLIASYTRPLGHGLKLTISPAYGVDTVSFAGAQAQDAGPFTSVAIVNTNLSYRMRVDGKFGRFVLDTGLDLLNRVTRYQALVPVDDNLANSGGIDIPPSQLFRGSQELGLGGYIDLGIDITPRLRLIPSLRIDGYILDGQNRSSIDPRLTARYKLDDAWTLKAYAGQFTQPPQPEALDRRFGNPTVGLEHGYHYGLGYEWRPDRLWSLDSEIYYVDRRDLVVFTDDVVMNPDGTFTYVNFANTGRRESYGFEAILKREITEHFFGWLTYTYSKSKIDETDGTVVPVAFDEPHVMNAVASWKPGGGWELGLRFQYATGRPDTPVIGSTYDADSGEYVPVRGPNKSIRISDFRQLDARVEKDWLYDTWSIGVYMDILNVTNTKNVEAHPVRLSLSPELADHELSDPADARRARDVVKRAVIFLAACGSFADPDIVVDLRVLALDATVPEQVIDVDFTNPPSADQILAQLVPSTVCALVADPNFDRRIHWSMTLCPFSEDERCVDGDPNEIISPDALLDDPDLTTPEPVMCATVPVDGNLIGVLDNALSGDELHGLQGVDYSVSLRLGGEGGDPALDLFASKTLRVAARVPAARTANTNPSIDHLEVAVGDNDSETLSTPVTLPLGRCIDQTAPFVVAPDKKVRINPIEPAGVRETYVIPTLDGKSEMFTETLTYQWTATQGEFSSGDTGGPKDLGGNPAPLFTDWHTPKASDLKGVAVDVALWVVQRDERLGVHWYESCLRVQP